MSVRSYTKVWLHTVWSTYNREKILTDRNLRIQLSKYLYEYADEKKIYMKVNFVNPEHVHSLIDLPTNMAIEEAFHLLKGSSSRWINNYVNFKFSWGKGYGAFSVSESSIDRVVKYIINQEEHHRVKSFTEEYEGFLEKHKLLSVVNG
jgi:putative transposase